MSNDVDYSLVNCGGSENNISSNDCSFTHVLSIPADSVLLLPPPAESGSAEVAVSMALILNRLQLEDGEPKWRAALYTLWAVAVLLRCEGKAGLDSWETDTCAARALQVTFAHALLILTNCDFV